MTTDYIQVPVPTDRVDEVYRLLGGQPAPDALCTHTHGPSGRRCLLTAGHRGGTGQPSAHRYTR
jgi:hypothetical protein